MDDREIIELYNQRSERAIVETPKKYGSYCFSIAINILTNEQDSEECVNDTWVRVWESIPPNAPKHLKLFLARITRNLAFDRFKEKNRQRRGGGELTVALHEISEMLPGVDSAEASDEEKKFTESLNRFLRSLPERECNIFIKRYFYTESTKDIAKIYGLSEGNVLKILSRTRIKLKKHLESEDYKV